MGMFVSSSPIWLVETGSFLIYQMCLSDFIEPGKPKSGVLVADIIWYCVTTRNARYRT